MATYAQTLEGRGGILRAEITLEASATTDGMDITINITDHGGDPVKSPVLLEMWMSEDSTGAGLTADTYSGDLSESTGDILSAHTAKKHWSVMTNSSGVFAATLVDSANPADQYVAFSGAGFLKVHVSEASGTNWEGA